MAGNLKKEKDTVLSFLKKNPKNNKSSVYQHEISGSKRAVLHYQVIQKLDNYSLLEIICIHIFKTAR